MTSNQMGLGQIQVQANPPAAVWPGDNGTLSSCLAAKTMALEKCDDLGHYKLIPQRQIRRGCSLMRISWSRVLFGESKGCWL
jgi:hypothetical protein